MKTRHPTGLLCKSAYSMNQCRHACMCFFAESHRGSLEQHTMINNKLLRGIFSRTLALCVLKWACCARAVFKTLLPQKGANTQQLALCLSAYSDRQFLGSKDGNKNMTESGNNSSHPNLGLMQSFTPVMPLEAPLGEKVGGCKWSRIHLQI